MSFQVIKRRVIYQGNLWGAGSLDACLQVYAFAISNNFSIHAVTAIKTLIRHESQCRIFVFGLEDCPDFEKYIKRLGRGFNCQVIFVLVDKSTFLHLPLFSHLGYEAYLRLSMPEILGGETKKIIYLDSDLVIENPISEMSSFCSTMQPFAACSISGTPGTLENKKRVGFTNEMPYFNSGVMVINVDSWLRNKLTEKVFDILKREGSRLKCPDQDALNIAVRGQFSRLPVRYNVTSECYRSDAAASAPSEVIEATKRPAIIHFTGRNKPWIPLRRLPGTATYVKNRMVIQPRFIVSFAQQTLLWFLSRAFRKLLGRP